MSTTVVQSVNRMVEERYSRKIDQYSAKYSPWFREMFGSSEKVTMDDTVSREYYADRIFSCGEAGALQWGSMDGGVMADVGNAPDFQVYQELETYPGLNEAVHHNEVHRRIKLKLLEINLFAKLGVIRAAQLGASIGSRLDRTIQGASKKVAREKIICFFLGNYTVSSTSYGGVLGQFRILNATAEADRTITKNGLDIDLLDTNDTGSSAADVAGNMATFSAGQQVDIYARATMTRVNTGPVIISKAKYYADTSGNNPESAGGSLTLYTIGSEEIILGPSADTTYDIVPRKAGSTEDGGNRTTLRIPTGIEQILIRTGALPYVNADNTTIITVDNYPDLQSHVINANGDLLTENYFIGAVAKCQAASMEEIDRAWCAPGVYSAFFENLDGYNRRERQGARYNVRAGTGGDPSFGMGDTEFTLKQDRYIIPGTCYGVKMRDQNYKMIVPPRIPGTRTHGSFGSSVEFVAPLMTGVNDIFMAYLAPNGKVTKTLQAPGECPYEILPEFIPGVKIYGLGEFYK